MSEGGPGLGDSWPVFWTNRWTIIGLAVAGGILSFLISFLLPPVYQATTTLISAGPSDKFSALSQLSPDLGEFGLQAIPKANSPAMYPEIVRSRRVLGEVLLRSFSKDRNGSPITLIEQVQPGPRGPGRTELAIRKLRSRVDALLDRRTGVLTIRVRASSPVVAAGMANTLDTLLQEFTVHSFISHAGENREFVEGRLKETAVALARAEESLRGFRERNLRIGNSPRLLLEEGRLVRGQREQEEIYLTLMRQYELAKIEEHRDVPTINVLDVAAVPVFRLYPQRRIIAMLGFLVGASVGILLVSMRGRRG